MANETYTVFDKYLKIWSHAPAFEMYGLDIGRFPVFSWYIKYKPAAF